MAENPSPRPTPFDGVRRELQLRPDATALDRMALETINILIAAIAEHYNQQKTDRCQLDDDRLYATLDWQRDALDPAFALPPKDEFLGDCGRYWEQRQPTETKGTGKLAAGCATIAQLTARVDQSQRLLGQLVALVERTRNHPDTSVHLFVCLALLYLDACKHLGREPMTGSDTTEKTVV